MCQKSHISDRGIRGRTGLLCLMYCFLQNFFLKVASTSAHRSPGPIVIPRYAGPPFLGNWSHSHIMSILFNGKVD